MNYMYEWNNKDGTIKIYATIDQAKKYEKDENVKLIQGGKIISIFNTQTSEVFSSLSC